MPKLFATGKHLLLNAGQSDSGTYLFLSALVLAVALLPWCFCMGTTFPFMMAYVREREAGNADSFSFLYLANVLGAVAGTVLTAVVFVELFGFHDTLGVAAACNFAITGISLLLALAARSRPASSETERPAASASQTRSSVTFSGAVPKQMVRWLLFTTGFVSMAMEVVWTRAFAPVLKTQVYSFAAVVAAYLTATFIGSALYRRDLRHRIGRSTAAVLIVLCGSAFLPILVNDPRLVEANLLGTPQLKSCLVLLASIAPFCGLLGYLTPSLVDRYAAGAPEGAGTAYAVNVLGCILGPLVASYILLPNISERSALEVLTLPFLLFAALLYNELPRKKSFTFSVPVGVVVAAALCFPQDFEEYVATHVGPPVVRRDFAASVLSAGRGMGRHLIVNGIGMTKLTPITKFMSHLPLAFHRGQPKSALVVCLGMGTSYRSCLSWNIDTTAVELVPSVKAAFGYYHADAAAVLANPKGHIVIDDGRRFLERTRSTYDVIVIDPPPPVEAAGTSLLYSEEFYTAAKRHLNTNGILQAWIPTEGFVGRAALRSLCNAFPYVRCFGSVEGWGVHFLASMQPIDRLSAAELVARMPETARQDLQEWAPPVSLETYMHLVLSREMSAEAGLNPNPEIRITDDLPYNEYFLLRAYGIL